MDIATILGFLVALLVTTASFLLISRITFIGVEVDSVKIGFISAAVLGLVNALIKPILEFFGGIANFLTLGLLQGFIAFAISVICFGIAARLVEGFRLRKGIWSAIMGALALSLASSLVYYLIEKISTVFA